MDLEPYKKQHLANARRQYQRQRAKADQALAWALSPLGHISDLLEFERFAEAQQLALRKIEAIENWEALCRGQSHSDQG